MSQHIQIGKNGEELAAAYLQRHGYVIVDRNWRCHAGELDIVATRSGQLVVVEVKARSSDQYGHPLEALTPTKIARLYRLAVLWCVSHQWRGTFRVDALSVLFDRDQVPTIEHLEGIQ